MDSNKNFVLIFLVTFTAPIYAGVPLSRYENLMKRSSDNSLGLYDHNDNVTILTNANFKEVVVDQNRSALVEFYNSYCGHCKRFAPFYKQLAEQLYAWRDLLPICAIDCAAEENNDICREYEIMAYPTLRYFRPGFKPSEKNYGSHIDAQDFNGIRRQLVNRMVAENRTANMSAWPNFQPVTESETSGSLFEGLDSQCRFIVLVYESNSSTVGIDTILKFQRWPSIQVRRITDLDIAKKFQIDGVNYKIATVDRTKNITPYSTKETTQDYINTIENFLKSQQLTEKPVIATTELNQNLESLDTSTNNATIEEVKRNKHLVYQADLEMAIRGIIFNEIPKVADIDGERLLALQKFFAVLKRYNPLGENGRAFVSNVYDFVMKYNQHLSGKEFEAEVLRLSEQLSPIFSSNHFVGCIATFPGLRGFTCSLWQLFHFLTAQSMFNEVTQDPLEVLQAIHGYIKYFFGCTDCSDHFQAMASRRKIWSVPNKEEAVLWLWAAHNEVNQRLAGDSTEDPKFPKIQFPSYSSCPQCYKQQKPPSMNTEISWDKDAVLSFLKNIHNPEYISRYGVEHEELLRPTLGKLRQKRMLTNIFSDIDMRMGMLLYGFCIVMMVAAFKLFAFKGYRKRPYAHDILGKV